MRFPVFPDQPGHVQELGLICRNLNPNLIPKPLNCLPTPLLGGIHLSLDEALKQAATALPGLSGAEVEALQELVGNGDHYLGHGMSIYGIAGGQNGHGADREG